MPFYRFVIYEYRNADSPRGNPFYTGNSVEITVFDPDDRRGIGDLNPTQGTPPSQLETGEPPTIYAVNGDTAHPWVAANAGRFLFFDQFGTGTDASGSQYDWIAVNFADDAGNGLIDVSFDLLDGTGTPGGFTRWVAIPEGGRPPVAGQARGDFASTRSWDREALPELVCFAGGTLIQTDRGDVAIEDLEVEDIVLTVDSGYQQIRWIGKKHVESKVLTDQPKLKPIRIKAGSLGDGLPKQDLMVSPQHRILISSRIAARMFGSEEVLVAAKHLVALPGIDIAEDIDSVDYYHMLFDDHQIVWSNGARSESLYTGPEALKALSQAARDEVMALFPELADVNYKAMACRPMTTGRMGRQLAIRHEKNGKELVQALDS